MFCDDASERLDGFALIPIPAAAMYKCRADTGQLPILTAKTALRTVDTDDVVRHERCYLKHSNINPSVKATHRYVSAFFTKQTIKTRSS